MEQGSAGLAPPVSQGQGKACDSGARGCKLWRRSCRPLSCARATHQSPVQGPGTRLPARRRLTSRGSFLARRLLSVQTRAGASRLKQGCRSTDVGAAAKTTATACTAAAARSTLLLAGRSVDGAAISGPPSTCCCSTLLLWKRSQECKACAWLLGAGCADPSNSVSCSLPRVTFLGRHLPLQPFLCSCCHCVVLLEGWQGPGYRTPSPPTHSGHSWRRRRRAPPGLQVCRSLLIL